MADEKIRLSQKEVKTFSELKGMGGVHFPVFKDNTNYYKLPLSEMTQIKDNAYDSDDNITEVQELTFFRNTATGANYPRVSSGEREYGILLPPPSLASDQNKVPVYKAGDQIAWESVQTDETIEHILDLSTLDEENSTFDVVLTANRNNAISFVGTSEETAIVSIEIEDSKPYNIQIVGACTLAITGVEWWGDAITDITAKAEINILNGRAMGVLIDV